MVVYKKQKQYGVLGAGLANIGSGLGAAVGGVVKGAATLGGGLIKAAVPTLTGIGQVGASGLAAGSLGLKAAALWGAAHPLLLGGLGAYALYKILKRRRERRMQERGYSVVERVFSNVPKGELRVKRIVDAAKRLNQNERGIRAEKLMRLKKFSDSSEYIDPNEPYVPKGPRELVPKKIVKKAKKSGVVQKDQNGNWRIINMNGPQGPVYWKPVYKSRESAENCLRAYQSGGWKKK